MRAKLWVTGSILNLVVIVENQCVMLNEQIIKKESKQYDCKVIQRLKLERKGAKKGVSLTSQLFVPLVEGKH